MSWIEQTESYFHQLNLKNLWIDNAYLNISNERESIYYLYNLSSRCVKCPFKKMGKVEGNNDSIFIINTAQKLQMWLYNKDHGQYVFPNQSNDGLIWSDDPELGEFGVYDLILHQNGTNSFQTALEPVPIYWCK